MALKNHSLIENTHGEIRNISRPSTRLVIIRGLFEVLDYERNRAIEDLAAEAEPEIAELLAATNPNSDAPKFDN